LSREPRADTSALSDSASLAPVFTLSFDAIEVNGRNQVKL